MFIPCQRCLLSRRNRCCFRYPHPWQVEGRGARCQLPVIFLADQIIYNLEWWWWKLVIHVISTSFMAKTTKPTTTTTPAAAQQQQHANDLAFIKACSEMCQLLVTAASMHGTLMKATWHFAGKLSCFPKFHRLWKIPALEARRTYLCLLCYVSKASVMHVYMRLRLRCCQEGLPFPTQKILHWLQCTLHWESPIPFQPYHDDHQNVESKWVGLTIRYPNPMPDHKSNLLFDGHQWFVYCCILHV